MDIIANVCNYSVMKKPRVTSPTNMPSTLHGNTSESGGQASGHKREEAQKGTHTSNSARAGTWSALQHKTFRNFWIASFFAYIGAAMHGVGAAWLMTELDSSPLMVGLVQGALNLSIFLVVMPAGVLSDMINRKWVMAGALTAIMATVGIIGLLTLNNLITPSSLLFLTFIFGISVALLSPAMQATVPDLINSSELPSAVTLNGLGSSTGRAIGPGLAGLLLTTMGVGWMFMLNIFTFVSLSFVIFFWHNDYWKGKPKQTLFWKAFKEGLYFTKSSHGFKNLLIKSSVSFIPISVLLALIPLIVIEHLNSGPGTLGIILSCFGVGSVVCSLILSRLYQHFSRHTVINLAVVIYSIAIILIVSTDQLYMVSIAMLIAGIAWTAVMTSINISAQLLLPDAIRARGLSISMMVMMGSVALGSVIWGQTAELFGLQRTYFVAGLLGLTVPLLTMKFRIEEDILVDK
ncbi:MAG: MFS transporter [Pseudomonadales bacterium]